MNATPEQDLQLIYDAAAKTPCLNPRNASDVAAWIQGAARWMQEQGAKTEHLTSCYQSAEKECGWLRDVAVPELHRDLSSAETALREIEGLVRQLFTDYLDVVEESDSGREFRPTTIGTCRAMQAEPLYRLLLDLRAKVGLPPPAPLNVRDAAGEKQP